MYFSFSLFENLICLFGLFEHGYIKRKTSPSANENQHKKDCKISE
jgi:hypothetical protein